LFDRYPDSIVLCLGRYDEAGRRVASDWGINAHVRFSGYVPNPELETWLACADVFLIPLLAESVNDFYRSPGRLADYCAAGRPVVAPDIGETGRVIRDEGIGLTAAQDMSDLDRQLGRLIYDHDLAEQLGARARELAETTLAEDTLAERLEDFVAGIYRRQIG
jgi:phosphatidylinositol alpha-1,6-mannosyltransferase